MMGIKDLEGRLADATGLSSAPQIEPVPVSPVPASIPSAIGFTGTQTGLSDKQKETLTGVLIGFREGGSLWMHNGDCIGADEYAGNAWRFLGGKIDLHPPENKRKRAFLSNSVMRPVKPYLVRNHCIVDECDVLVCTPGEFDEQLRSGTWSTIRYARKAGKTRFIIWPDGSLSIESPI